MLKRLLITGAAGNLGRMTRARLQHLAEEIRVSDLVPIDRISEKEEIVQANLAEYEAVSDLVQGCDGILHLGGVSVEQSYDLIEAANLRGVHNLYEAARVHGMPRIVFASSNHTIGFYPQTERLTADAPTRPDGWYGVSKVYGEAVAQMYHAKFGQETARLRIGSCFEKPVDRRMMATWFSYDDFCSLMERLFSVPKLGCPVIWGASANSCGWWDNSHIQWLGWAPKDNSEMYRDAVETLPPRPADAPDVLWQGGMFTADPIIKD